MGILLMENTRKRKTPHPIESDEDAVEVRVSARTPRARPVTRTPVSRAQTLATGLLEAVISQVADYIETSNAVERLIRNQTRQVLHELAHDPEFTALIHLQARQYVAELASHPEILETFVRAQVDRYLGEKGGGQTSSHTPQTKVDALKPRKRKPRKAEITLE